MTNKTKYVIIKVWVEARRSHSGKTELEIIIGGNEEQIKQYVVQRNFITTASIKGYIVLGIGAIISFILQRMSKHIENRLYHPTE